MIPDYGSPECQLSFALRPAHPRECIAVGLGLTSYGSGLSVNLMEWVREFLSLILIVSAFGATPCTLACQTELPAEKHSCCDEEPPLAADHDSASCARPCCHSYAGEPTFILTCARAQERRLTDIQTYVPESYLVVPTRPPNYV